MLLPLLLHVVCSVPCTVCGKLNEWQPVTHGSVFANVLSMELPHYRWGYLPVPASFSSTFTSLSLTLSFLSAFSSYFVAHFYALLLLHRIMKWILHDIDSPAGSSSFWSLPPTTRSLSTSACCTVAFLITWSLAGAWACGRVCLRLWWAHRINRKRLAA